MKTRETNSTENSYRKVDISKFGPQPLWKSFLRGACFWFFCVFLGGVVTLTIFPVEYETLSWLLWWGFLGSIVFGALMYFARD